MNVIAKISCYFEHIIVTLKLRKEYLNTVACNTPVLLRIKYWTVWYIERYSMSTYTGLQTFKKQSGFFGPPCTLWVIQKGKGCGSERWHCTLVTSQLSSYNNAITSKYNKTVKTFFIRSSWQNFFPPNGALIVGFLPLDHNSTDKPNF